MNRKIVIDALCAADTALTDWVRYYAPEQCESKSVGESISRVFALGGTLAYIADTRTIIKAALKEMRKRK